MNQIILNKNEFNTALTFTVLNAHNVGDVSVRFMGNMLKPGVPFSYPNMQGVPLKERLLVQFGSEVGNKELIINYF